MTYLTIGFDPAKLEKLKKKLGPDLTLPPLKDLMASASRIAYDEAKDRSPSFLSQIIRQDPPTADVARISVHSPAARAVESGRRPLIAGGKFPPPDAFLRMARGSAAVAFLIARSVAKRGTKGRFFMKKAISATNRQMPALAQRMSDAIEQRFSAP